jgi:DNA-directed RNA polymerase specialized sigma54-like protein
MGNSARNDADSQFIRSNLQEARWLIKSLESRNDTLLRVSRCIVEQQQAFRARRRVYETDGAGGYRSGRRDA